MHTNLTLFKAIVLAGSRKKLCDILQVHKSNLSSWTNGHTSMPIKHAKTIEHWSNGELTIADMYPEFTKSEITTLMNEDVNDTIQKLITKASKENLLIKINVSLEPKSS